MTVAAKNYRLVAGSTVKTSERPKAFSTDDIFSTDGKAICRMTGTIPECYSIQSEIVRRYNAHDRLAWFAEQFVFTACVCGSDVCSAITENPEDLTEYFSRHEGLCDRCLALLVLGRPDEAGRGSE